ncbi:hypothetical protein ES703_91415 [subsurface metagenome]
MKISEVMIIEELESIKKAAEKLVGKNERVLLDHSYGSKMLNYSLCTQVDKIIIEYNWIVPHVNSLFKELSIDFEIEKDKKIDADWEKIKEGTFDVIDDSLIALSLTIGRVLSILKNLATKTQENKNKFEDLKSEIKDLENNLPINIIKNLYEAVDELELNKLLGASLICGRLIVSQLDLVPGNIDEKIKELQRGDLLKNRGASDWLIKANQKIRGTSSHDLNYFPNPSETLAILGDTMKVVEIVQKYINSKKDLLT